MASSRAAMATASRGSRVSLAPRTPNLDEAHKENRIHRADDARHFGVSKPSGYAAPLAAAARATETLKSLGRRYDDEGDDDSLGDEDADAHGGAVDATDDIQDIDRRLNALQQFLSAAKAPPR